MTIVSLPFFAFVAALVLVYFLAPKGYRWVVLLAGSYFFYWLNSRWLLLVMMASSIVTFGVGLWIQRVQDANRAYVEAHAAELSREDKKNRNRTTKEKTRRILLLGVLLDLGALLFLKYFNFFASSVNGVFTIFGVGLRVPSLNLLLPLGISFYTLQAIAYMTDIYRGKAQADKNPAKFMLFMSFFPQIVQGPIPRYNQLAPQLYEGHDFDYKRLCFGVQLMLWGLIKKLIIAERIALPVNYLFDRPTEYSGPIVFLAAAMYGLQVYADFSGGMDIARGVAQMLGIDLELNFRQPYFSGSVEEFWRRWHITMGSWMRDYVFYPLSMSKAFTSLGKKSRKWFGAFVGKRIPPFCAMFIVYFLVGLWHGPTWSFVMFGVWNGIFIMLGILLDDVYAVLRKKCGIVEESVTWRVFRIVRTFVVISYGRFFSRAPGLKKALEMIRRSFMNWRDLSFLTNGTLLKMGLNNANWFVLLAFILVLFYVDCVHEKRNVCIREAIARQSLIFRWIIYIAAVLALLVFGIYGPTYDAASFIYQNF